MSRNDSTWKERMEAEARAAFAGQKPLDLETRLAIAEAALIRWAEQAKGWHRRYCSASAALLAAAALAALEFVLLLALVMRAVGVD